MRVRKVLILALWDTDIQNLSIKYFGDELTEKEMQSLQSICSPQDWCRVDDGGYEGVVAHLLQAIIAVIGIARSERRGQCSS